MTPAEIDKLREEAKRFELKAPKGYFKTSAEYLAETTGGCGPGPVGDKLVSDSLYGLNVTAACNIHDYGYHIANNETDRHKADLFFLMNMLTLNDAVSIGWFKKQLRKYRAFHYYLAVSIFGKAFKKVD